MHSQSSTALAPGASAGVNAPHRKSASTTRRLSKLGQAALEYAAHGWKVLPLRPGTKRAMPEGGFHAATDDPEKIRRWWSATPEANVAIACGMSDLVVIDLDQKNGKDGRAEWERLALTHGFEPNGVLSATTASGGTHLYYRMPTHRLKTATDALAAGVDVLGDNGQVVAPPSVIDGKEYSWSDGDHVPGDLPAAVVDLLTRAHDPWPVRTLADALARTEPVRYLVDGLIPDASVILLHGLPATMKSMLAADLAFCVAAGIPFLEPAPGESVASFPVRKAPVFWLDLDQGERRTASRFAAFARAHGVRDGVQLYYVASPTPAFLAGDVAATADLIDRLERLQVGLLVIDTLGSSSGGADLSSYAQMEPVMASLRAISERTGAAVIAIHHDRKGGAPSSQESSNGSIVIPGKVDLTLGVSRDKDAGTVRIKPDKTRDADVRSFEASFAFEHAEDGRTLHTARFFGVGFEPASEKDADDVDAKILDALDNGPLYQDELFKAVRKRRETVTARLGALHLAGLIKVDDQGAGRKKTYVRS